MVDLETGDNCPTAAIVSIGAVVFSPSGVGRSFYRAVDINTSVGIGLTVSADTMAWWGRQSAEAREVFTDPARAPVQRALDEFAAFLSDLPDVKVWGNGASFDNAILQVAYRLCGLPLPWKFWNDRCYRTASADLPRRTQSGTHHNALDDAVSQANHLIAFAPHRIV